MVKALGLDRPDSREFLREIATGTGEEASAALSSFVRNAPHEVRDIAYNAIQSDDPTMRVSALNVLRSINGTEEINTFADLLKDKNLGIKVQAVEALGSNQDPYAMDLLVNAFEGGDNSIRVPAAYYLAQSGHPRALDLLVEATLSGTKESSSFYYAIEQLNTPESKEALLTIREKASKDDDALREDILNTELEEKERQLNGDLEGDDDDDIHTIYCDHHDCYSIY